MKCNKCSHEFERFEHFVLNKDKNGKVTFMCENCFFELALIKLNCESVKMDYKGTNYYNPVLETEDAIGTIGFADESGLASAT